MTITDQDLSRLIEANYDLDKGRAPSAITPDERYHSALTASHRPQFASPPSHFMNPSAPRR